MDSRNGKIERKTFGLWYDSVFVFVRNLLSLKGFIWFCSLMILPFLSRNQPNDSRKVNSKRVLDWNEKEKTPHSNRISPLCSFAFLFTIDFYFDPINWKNIIFHFWCDKLKNARSLKHVVTDQNADNRKIKEFHFQMFEFQKKSIKTIRTFVQCTSLEIVHGLQILIEKASQKPTNQSFTTKNS